MAQGTTMKLRVEEMMTPGVIALHEQDTVIHADEQMRLADISHIPVVDVQNHVVGIVSNRDILKTLAIPDGRGMRIGEIMSRDVITVAPEAPAFRAAEMMLDNKIGALPVVGDDEVLIGIVTETDFLSVAHNALQGRTGGQLLGV